MDALPTAGPVGAGPVFSSRAVRDAAVVTAAVEALKRFADGMEPVDDLAFRLEGLSTDQLNFLQLSVEPLLLHRCVARGEDSKGAKAAALRRMLGDLAAGTSPASFSWSRPEKAPATLAAAPALAPVVPPVTAPPRSRTPPVPLPPRRPPPALSPALRPLPPRQSVPGPAAPLPAVGSEPAAAVAEMDIPRIIIPAQTSPPAESIAAVPPPAPPPRPAATADVARLSRAEADRRRMRLLDDLTTHLSSSEAVP
ncbi:hypothetical protein [Oleisolibacter albus]|uniref:hypothetical protein n=1 Tax=Oleisolibacter albus TaxID=2171757 RepID=UPI000DF34BE7|nr:hypothetical protein [Oleisolibacter albus]